MSEQAAIRDPQSPQATRLAERIRRLTEAAGFQDFGIAPAVTPRGIQPFNDWLDCGYGGEMKYLESRREAYQHPDSILEGCRSVIALTLPYRTDDPVMPQPGEARISRYAWGTGDYHDVVHKRLKNLKRELSQEFPDVMLRPVIDTAPLLERDFARLAGLGWQGKNTMLIRPDSGSWFFLAFLLTNQALPHSIPFEQNHCGTCTACLEACPTDAFVAPHQLNATRCISYLTIELRDAIPEDLRSGMGDWLFGCDVCQEVCPWNRFSTQDAEEVFEPHQEHNPIQLEALLELDDEQFRERFRKTPLWRSKRQGVLRNAAIVLGNQKHLNALPNLLKRLQDSDPVLREAVSWAIGEILQSSQLKPDQKHEALLALRELEKCEPVDWVREQVSRVIFQARTGGGSNS